MILEVLFDLIRVLDVQPFGDENACIVVYTGARARDGVCHTSHGMVSAEIRGDIALTTQSFSRPGIVFISC